jgi:general secretion pathway protein D
MFSGVRIAIATLSLLSVLAAGGCAELFEATSTWPEPDSPVDAVLKEPLPVGAPLRSDTPPVEAAPAPPQPAIIKGSGRFVQQPRPTAAVDTAGDITLNFASADIREVVKVVLGDILKLNYVVEPTVQGTVSIQTSRPLAESALLPTLETLLRLNGAALVESGGGFKVVPLAQAPRETRAVGVGDVLPPQRRGYGIQIVPLRFVSASEVVKILGAMVSETDILHIDTARNLLLLGGSRGDLESIIGTIALFDVDWLEGMSFGLIPLHSAEAGAVVEELTKILGEGENAPLADVLRLVPIERLNALMVISPLPAYIDKASRLIERLDQTSDQETPRLFVYYVQNKRAADLAQVLSQIYSGSMETATPREGLRPGLQPVEMRSSQTAQLPGATGESTAARGPLSSLRSAAATPRQRQSEARSGPAVASATLQVSADRTARITADENNNALVILATPADYRMLESTLKKLDLVPLQVLIEATIAEVSLRDELRYGLQWFFESGKSSATLSEATSGVVASLFPGFSAILAANDVRVVLDALDSITDINVISSPQLLVLDNTSAILQVGDEVPIATRSAVTVDAVTSSSDFVIANDIEQRNTGVILTVTPRVNAGGLVTLEIDQEISDVVPTESSGIDSPTIRQRRIQTTVAVQSGETVALGGLIRESRDRGKSGIPILHELPLLGALFGSTGDTKERTELLIVITPRVVRGRDETRDMTNELRKRLRSISPLDRKIR